MNTDLLTSLRERPLDVFHHPFAYAAPRGILASAADLSPVAA